MVYEYFQGQRLSRIRLELRYQEGGFDARRSWQGERVNVRRMEHDLEKSEDILVEVEESETVLLGPTDVAGIITALAENACVGAGGRAAAGRYVE